MMHWYEVISEEYSFLFLTMVTVLMMHLQRGRAGVKQVMPGFGWLNLLSCVLVVLDRLGSYLYPLPGMAVWCDLITHVKYALRPALLCMVLLISEREASRKRKICMLLPLLALTGILIVSFPFGWVAYHRPETNGFCDGPLLPVTWLVLLVYMALIIRAAVSAHSSREERAVLLLGEGFIAFNILNERVLGLTIPGMEHTVTALAILIYFLYFCFRTEEEYRMVKEQELSQARIQAMISQIKPHFIYNSLACIAEICHEDSACGEEAILAFSAYLRSCFQSLTADGLVPFTEELTAIQRYLELEKLQDPEKCTVVYDIREQHFLIPILSVETLVENAVKHGICKKRGSGTVTLRTVREDRGIVITIRDDGAGFDPKKVPEDTAHLGLKNSQLRLQEQCGAQLTVASEPGVGTEITIVMPEGGSR